jgi:Kef-type K+ transport system membrane component KefB
MHTARVLRPKPRLLQRRAGGGLHLACFAALVFALLPRLVGASESAHANPVANVALALALLLLGAKLGGDLAGRIGQPAVLGELMAGVLLGNLGLLGIDDLTWITKDPMLDLLAQLGVIVLLFEVGLESTVGQMMKVGASSLLVATVGVLAPGLLGWFVASRLLPDASSYVHAFIGATLCATSVGITARVFQDLNSSSTTEARIVLGAAVIDDVMGLVVLAVVTGLIAAADRGLALSYLDLVVVVAKAGGFLFGALAIGGRVAPYLFHLASRLKARGVLLGVGLAFCFSLAWAASAIGLAPIVGAFAAGLILDTFTTRTLPDGVNTSWRSWYSPSRRFWCPSFSC